MGVIVEVPSLSVITQDGYNSIVRVEGLVGVRDVHATEVG
jgi:hypothetical protein